jgi:site-specific DNA-cytosine methylase
MPVRIGPDADERDRGVHGDEERLDRGRGIEYLTRNFERLGYRWAYRIVDTRAFGLPHRRERVFLFVLAVAIGTSLQNQGPDFMSGFGADRTWWGGTNVVIDPKAT